MPEINGRPDPHRSLDDHEDAETAARTAGQRMTSLLWEITQAAVALGITSAIVAMSVKEIPIPNELWGMAFLIIGFYFGRTNHTKVGGVGPHHHVGQRR